LSDRLAYIEMTEVIKSGVPAAKFLLGRCVGLRRTGICKIRRSYWTCIVASCSRRAVYYSFSFQYDRRSAGAAVNYLFNTLYVKAKSDCISSLGKFRRCCEFILPEVTVCSDSEWQSGTDRAKLSLWPSADREML